jgi:F plasmid transfer operon, TraF, protein
MRKKPTAMALTLAVCAWAVDQRAAAQGLETTGNRAAALAAFVAVADDASAVVWNPAGLVAGPIFNISSDLGRSTVSPDGLPFPPAAAGKLGTTLLAAGVPPLGLSYYRLSVTSAEAAGPAVRGVAGRENSEVIVRTLVTSHLGATVLQSLGDYVTLGATAKLVHGRIGAIVVDSDSWDEALDRADTIDTDSSIVGDVDVGMMFSANRVRAGVVVRNVTEPSFDEDQRGAPVTLERHARAGVAWGDRWPGTARTIVAFDADLTRLRQATGERRDVAVGAERWLQNRRMAIRGGVRASTVGEMRPVATVGGSYAIRAGTYVDAYVARGTVDQRAWGIGARLTY